MSPGPLRRLAGAVGLVALAPTAVLLVTGAVTVGDAAVRAAVTLAGVMVLARVAGWWLSVMAAGFEREQGEAGDTPRRRASDRVP